MRFTILLILSALLYGCDSKIKKQTILRKNQNYNGPIIDMHIHSANENEFSLDSMAMCLPLSSIVTSYDPKDDYGEVFWGKFNSPDCDNPIWAPRSYEEYITRLNNQFNKYQLSAVVSGDYRSLMKLDKHFSDQLILGLQFRINRDSISVDSLSALIKKNGIKILGEISNQYGGIAPNDQRMYPYYALAEELDIPLAIHMGSGLPGTPRFLYPQYRVKYSNPLLLEEVLNKFPKLRVSVMHYGEPFVDEMIAMMVSYPQLYADIGGIMWAYPKDYFYESHLKKMVSAGLGKRIMFGSDMIIWPELIEESVEIINNAEFLTQEQKADIYYHNASRFLRLNVK